MANIDGIISNEKMASILAKKCYSPNVDVKDLAVQLFVERVCLPNNYDKLGYTEKEMKIYILNYLNGAIGE